MDTGYSIFGQNILGPSGLSTGFHIGDAGSIFNFRGLSTGYKIGPGSYILNSNGLNTGYSIGLGGSIRGPMPFHGEPISPPPFLK